MLSRIFEYENSQEISTLVDKPQLQIYEFIVGFVKTACPQIIIEKPLSLQE